MFLLILLTVVRTFFECASKNILYLNALVHLWVMRKTLSHNSSMNNDATYRSKTIWAAELWHHPNSTGSLCLACCQTGLDQKPWELKRLFWCFVGTMENLGVWWEMSGLQVSHYLETQRGSMQHWCWIWYRSDCSWCEQRCCSTWCYSFG